MCQSQVDQRDEVLPQERLPAREAEAEGAKRRHFPEEPIQLRQRQRLLPAR